MSDGSKVYWWTRPHIQCKHNMTGHLDKSWKHRFDKELRMLRLHHRCYFHRKRTLVWHKVCMRSIVGGQGISSCLGQDKGRSRL